MAQFFGTPFGLGATKVTIPDTDTDSVSWRNGYTTLYELDPTVEGNGAKHVERDIFNTLLYEITSSVQAIQLNGVAPYYDDVIGTNGPGYSEGSIVIYSNRLWRSKVAANRIKPNETTTTNWEEVFGYDSLVARMKKDGWIGSTAGGGGGSATDSYTRSQIDEKFTDVETTLNDYLYMELGEIFLLTWINEDRNTKGFFLCNGEKLPFDIAQNTDTVYHGNKLYELCYDDVTEAVKVETEFKKRWNIQIDETAKTIQLPNILGLKDDGTYVIEEGSIFIGVDKESGLTDYANDGLGYLTSDTVSSDEDPSEDDPSGSDPDPSPEPKPDNVFMFKMLPCVYLGMKSDGTDEIT